MAWLRAMGGSPSQPAWQVVSGGILNDRYTLGGDGSQQASSVRFNRTGSNDDYGWIYGIDFTDYSSINITYTQSAGIVPKISVGSSLVYTGDTSAGTKTATINVSSYSGVQALQFQITNTTGTIDVTSLVLS